MFYMAQARASAAMAMLVTLVSFISLSDANSAGVGIPCRYATDPNVLLGHPTRADLATFTDPEARKEHMVQIKAQGYKMQWTTPNRDATKRKIFSPNYSIRTGDGLLVNDPTNYKNDQWQNIYIRTLKEGEQFTGLILLALDENDNVVGEWQTPKGSPYLYRADSDGMWCVTHSNAGLKHYLTVFRFKGPPLYTGTIRITALVKVGLAFPVLDGSFWYAYGGGMAQDLTLKEGGQQTQYWFQGLPGQDCHEVCAAAHSGAECDLAKMKTANSAEAVAAISQKYTDCQPPILPGCGGFTPSVGTAGCFYHDDLCGEKPPTPQPQLDKNPCVAPFPKESCMKWTFQRQNNAPQALNTMYEGQEVLICPTDNANFNSQDSFNDPNPAWRVEGLCGERTQAPTSAPPPAPPGKEPMSCEASFESPEDGGRICACKGVPIADDAASISLSMLALLSISVMHFM